MIGNPKPEINFHLILVRGLPGSGKSTYATKEATKKGLVHYEADMYHMVNGEYKFDRKKASKAHEWCEMGVRNTLSRGHSVIVSNTFTTNEEMEVYRYMASWYRAKFNVVEMKENYGSIHGVPEDVIEKMKDRWESDNGTHRRF